MPNKAVSQAQYRFFRAVQSGDVEAPGLSREEAGEMLGHQSPKNLPERAPDRVAKRMKGKPKRKAKSKRGY